MTPPAMRYTLNGGPEAEARIDADQQLIAEKVRKWLGADLIALVMIGGYGRGEGGILITDDGKPCPYNDYDYFVVIPSLPRLHMQKLREEMSILAHDLGKQVGVEVDFALLPIHLIPLLSPTLMHAEMLWGHRVVAGRQDVLSAAPAMPFADLPLGEFTRLMLNRGALLILNRLTEACRDDLDRAHFFRFVFKSVLASADAILAMQGLYSPSHEIKKTCLEAHSWFDVPELAALYPMAWAQKFNPYPEKLQDLEPGIWQLHAEQLWLEVFRKLEEHRIGHALGPWHDYAAPHLDKGQADGANPFKNLLLNLYHLGPVKMARTPAWCLTYPRDRLIAALPLLLSGAAGKEVAAPLKKALGLGQTCRPRLAHRKFIELWRQFS